MSGSVFPARKECKQLIHLITLLHRQVCTCPVFIVVSNSSIVSILEETAACSWTLVVCSKWTDVQTLPDFLPANTDSALILGY
jgi:hypothetical protein